jgi:parallel beta-helix repeat protein
MLAAMAVLLLGGGAAASGSRSREIHVCAIAGDDTNSGLDAEAPLRTLSAARDSARRLRWSAANAHDTVNIILHASGVHHLAEPLVLDSRDSHTNFLAASTGGNGTVLVSGGIRVDETAVSPRPGHTGQFQANLTALGLTDLGTVLPAAASGGSSHQYTGILHPQLFIAQQSGLLARWPNARNQTAWQWAYTKDCLSRTCSRNCNCSSADITGFSWRTSQTNGSGAPPAVAHRWGAEADPYLHGYWRVDWRDGYLPLLGVDAARDGLIVGTAAAAAAPLSKVKTGSRYLVFNLLSELDSDGEYYLSRSDSTQGMLYFQPPAGSWPPPAGAGALEGAYVSSASHLVVLQDGTEHVSFRGISWQHARGTVIKSEGTVSHVIIDDCTVANSGGGGIELQGFFNVVRGSKVFNVGGTGVSVKGGLHRSLRRGNNVVTLNEIHHYAQWVRTYQPAILWAGVGNTYSFNHIHDAPHNGILGGGNEATCSTNGTETTVVEKMCGGNDCIFESNLIEHTNYECDDSGAFYTCGQQGTAFINRGNILRNNTFRRVRQEDRTFLGYPSVQAIYLDDQMSGWVVEGNTIIDAQMGIMVGGGRDTIVRNNNFIGCDIGLHIDSRGMGGEKPSCLGADMTSLNTAMASPAWAKYGLSAKMNPKEMCSPVNASAIGNCFSHNLQNWGLWCGAQPSCMNDAKWSGSVASGNRNGSCGDDDGWMDGIILQNNG